MKPRTRREIVRIRHTEKKFDRTIWEALSWKGRIIFLLIITPAMIGMSCFIGWGFLYLIFEITS